MGINNTKKCTFSFLLEMQVELQVLVILGAASFVNSPGEIFWRSSAILQMRSVEEIPARPVRPSTGLKANKKWRTSGSLGV